MGFAQVFPPENSECVYQALKQVFEHVGGVSDAYRVRQCHRGGQARLRHRAHHRDLRGLLGPLRVRLQLLQPEVGPREGQRRAQGRVRQAQPVRTPRPRPLAREVQRAAAREVLFRAI